jgi:hypothetical protein
MRIAVHCRKNVLLTPRPVDEPFSCCPNSEPPVEPLFMSSSLLGCRLHLPAATRRKEVSSQLDCLAFGLFGPAGDSWPRAANRIGTSTCLFQNARWPVPYSLSQPCSSLYGLSFGSKSLRSVLESRDSTTDPTRKCSPDSDPGGF